MYSPNRINLLSDQKIEPIYAIPEFNKAERALYFSLTDEEILIINKYRTVKGQIYFIRLLGYFKAKQQFYKFNLSQDNDSKFILGKYFEEGLSEVTGQIDFKTYQKQKTGILILFGFKDWLPIHEPKIQLHLSRLIKIYPKGHDALRQLLNYFSSQQIVLPSYRTIQDMFTYAYSTEDARLDGLISVIPESKKEQLSVLINKEDGITPLNVIR